MKLQKCELVALKTADDLLLHGMFYEPEKASAPKKLVIHIHGWTGNFYENQFLVHIAQEATKRSIAFLAINTRGAGHTTEFIRNKRCREYKMIGGSLEQFEECLLDINAAVEFAKSRGYKDIILEGHSTGCQKVTYYKFKTKSEDVKGLILLEPTDDPAVCQRFLGARYAEAMQYAKDLIASNRENDPMPSWLPFGVLLSAQRFLSMSDPESIEGRIFHYAGSLSEIKTLGCPVIAIFGEKTQYQEEPAEALEILRKTFKDCQARLLKNADHWFTGTERELAGEIVNWAAIVL